MPVIRVNLLPPRIKKERAKRAMIAVGVAAAAIFLTLPIGFWYLRWQQKAQLEAAIKKIDAESVPFAGVIEKVNALNTREGALVKRLDVLDKLVSRQSFWIHVLESIGDAQAAARDLWLSGITSHAMVGADAGKIELTIDGYAYSIASAEEFERSITQSDLGVDAPTPPEYHGADILGHHVIKFTVKYKVKA